MEETSSVERSIVSLRFFRDLVVGIQLRFSTSGSSGIGICAIFCRHRAQMISMLHLRLVMIMRRGCFGEIVKLSLKSLRRLLEFQIRHFVRYWSLILMRLNFTKWTIKIYGSFSILWVHRFSSWKYYLLFSFFIKLQPLLNLNWTLVELYISIGSIGDHSNLFRLSGRSIFGLIIKIIQEIFGLWCQRNAMSLTLYVFLFCSSLTGSNWLKSLRSTRIIYTRLFLFWKQFEVFNLTKIAISIFLDQPPGQIILP